MTSFTHAQDSTMCFEVIKLLRKERYGFSDVVDRYLRMCKEQVDDEMVDSEYLFALANSHEDGEELSAFLASEHKANF